MADATKTPAKNTKKTSKETDASETFSIPVRKAAAAPEPSQETGELKAHHELVLKAPKSLTPEDDASVDSAVPTAPEEQAEAAPAEVAPVPEKETPAPEPAAEEKPAASTEAKDQPLGAAPVEDMQSPTVFDTKQYHLPINESHQGSGSRFVTVFLVIILLLAIGGVVAIDAGWIDAGFDLPFDLIK